MFNNNKSKSIVISHIERLINLYYYSCPYYLMSPDEAIALHIFTLVFLGVCIYYTYDLFWTASVYTWELVEKNSVPIGVNYTVEWFRNIATSVGNSGKTPNDHPIT